MNTRQRIGPRPLAIPFAAVTRKGYIVPMSLCEGCGKRAGTNPVGIPELFDFCAACSRNLCPACMRKGCCGKVPAESGTQAEFGDGLDSDDEPADEDATDEVKEDASE